MRVLLYTSVQNAARAEDKEGGQEREREGEKRRRRKILKRKITIFRATALRAVAEDAFVTLISKHRY